METATTPDDVLTLLADAEAAQPDVRDLATARQRDTVEADLRDLRTLQVHIKNETNNVALYEAQLAPYRPAMEKLLTAEAAVQDDPQLLRLLQRGVGMRADNGEPALPPRLKTLLSDVCPHCGHEALVWQGGREFVEEIVKDLGQRLDRARDALAFHLAHAEQLLASPTRD